SHVFWGLRHKLVAGKWRLWLIQRKAIPSLRPSDFTPAFGRVEPTSGQSRPEMGHPEVGHAPKRNPIHDDDVVVNGATRHIPLISQNGISSSKFLSNLFTVSRRVCRFPMMMRFSLSLTA